MVVDRERRSGAEPHDCSLGPEGVSTRRLPHHHRHDAPALSQECATTGMRSLDGVSAPECKKRTNLWILWKTQDSIVPSLWITPRGALSPGASSDRIHDVQESILWTRCTFKTPVQRPCLRRARHMGPRSSRTVIHSPAGGAGALSSLIHNVGRGTVPESV